MSFSWTTSEATSSLLRQWFLSCFLLTTLTPHPSPSPLRPERSRLEGTGGDERRGSGALGCVGASVTMRPLARLPLRALPACAHSVCIW